jgi:DHA1 family bicyclomycin/chloramphenicol resistance-like MFS transporter
MSTGSRAPSPHPGLGFVGFVLMIASLQAMAALGVDSMLPNLPAISDTFHLTADNERQLVITAYLIGFGLPQIVYGPLADRFGRKPVLLFGCSVYVVFSALAAFAPSFELLILARALQGMGAAATRAIPNSVIRDCYAGRQMAKVMSLSLMIFMACPMLAPSLGAGIAVFASWRWVFGVLTLFGAAVATWVAFKLPETLHPEDRTPIVPSRIGHNFGVALKSRQGMGYAFALTFLIGALFGFVNSVEQVFHEVFGQPGLFPLAFALIAGCMSLSSLTNAWLVERMGMRPLSHRALIAFIAINLAHAAVAITGHESIVTFCLFQAAAMFAFGLMTGNFGAMAMEPLGHVAGAAASLQGMFSALGGSLIGFYIGQQFNRTTVPLSVGYALCGCLTLLCVLYAERGKLFRTHHAPHPAAEPAVIEVH